MTVQDLIDVLEDMDNPEAKIRLAMQPRWAFEYTIGEVVEALVAEDGSEDEETVVYIGEGSQTRYLPGVVFQELGW